MRFSIRFVLGVTMLAALGILSWNNLLRLRHAEAEASVVQAEISVLERQLSAEKPDLHRAKSGLPNEVERLKLLEQQAIEFFDRNRAKYDAVEARGNDVLSYRLLDSLNANPDRAPVTYKLWVPKDREVWLKFGVHQGRLNSSSRHDMDNQANLLSDSPFTLSGPRQHRLPPGEHLLQFPQTSDAETLTVQVMLDEQTLLTTQCKSPKRASGSYTSPKDAQADAPADRRLPWLGSFRVRIPTADGKSENEYSYSFWLSDRASSGVAEFSGQ